MRSALAAVLIALAGPAAAQFGPGANGDAGFRERKAAAEDLLVNAQIAGAQDRYREDLKAAKEAYDRGEFELARRLFQPFADSDFAPAQYYLALMWEKGQGEPRDDAKAAVWLSRAAKAGYAPAQFNLGVAYLAGRGVAKDNRAGARWLRLAADQGLAPAQYDLGVLYENGQGVPRSAETAALWYARAAQPGHR
ncbi:MAG TPA: tetratricopeptide repeat protein [Caulobacteraceae bacterium]|nr:tetratricopeptide repeat protein [Caulobacteraceae bacterium]